MEAERRQFTVLFADMVGFTAFSQRSGEEAAFTLMQRLAKLMEDAVQEGATPCPDPRAMGEFLANALVAILLPSI